LELIQHRDRKTKTKESTLMSFARTAAVAALCVGGALATPATAAPAGLTHTKGYTTNARVERVDWRPYRHCHRRYGRRWCHGGRRYNRWGGPGINIYIGSGGRKHDRRRHRQYD
jgi:hypothetical protein